MDAGSAEVARGPDPPRKPRYRWRAEMSYLFGWPGAAGGWTDPVCGMPVAGDTPHALEGGAVRFCSAACLATYRGQPPPSRARPGAATRARPARPGAAPKHPRRPSALLGMFLGFNLTFLPMFWLGINGMNRRVADYQPALAG